MEWMLWQLAQLPVQNFQPSLFVTKSTGQAHAGNEKIKHILFVACFSLTLVRSLVPLHFELFYGDFFLLAFDVPYIFIAQLSLSVRSEERKKKKKKKRSNQQLNETTLQLHVAIQRTLLF